MIDIEQVIKEVSKRTGIDKDLVGMVCKHVFDNTVNIMKDAENTKGILFNKLFKFELKRRFKEDKTREYTAR